MSSSSSGPALSAGASVGHYENFPVASLFLPPRLRAPVGVIYRFARSADDFADEGQDAPAERLAKLNAYRTELDRIRDGQAPRTPLFVEVAAMVTEFRLPLAPFYDLLDAFSQDVVKQRYADFGEVMHYCSRSAAPVGRLLLHLYHAAQPDNIAKSDAICSALQLVNFWQDVAVDLAKDRIYLPVDEMARFGVDEAALRREDTGSEWHALMAFQVERARAMLESGAPLAKRLPGRIGFELRLMVQGGLRILEKIEAVRYDVFRRRPVLRGWDWPLLLVRALRM